MPVREACGGGRGPFDGGRDGGSGNRGVRLGGEFLFFAQGTLRQSREDPQVVRENAPADGELAMGKAFAADGHAEDIMKENSDSAFGLGATTLQTCELPRMHA